MAGRRIWKPGDGIGLGRRYYSDSEVMTSVFGPHFVAVVELVRSVHALSEDALPRSDAATLDPAAQATGLAAMIPGSPSAPG